MSSNCSVPGGAEWNGPAYDPKTNLVYIGEVQWCTTATLQTARQIAEVSPGAPWSGEASINPFNTWGKADPIFDWAGWVYASDADTGVWKWRVKTNYPIQSGMTPTAGGVVAFGDMGGNFYAVDATNGQKLWGQKIGGAIGGGVTSPIRLVGRKKSPSRRGSRKSFGRPKSRPQRSRSWAWTGQVKSHHRIADTTDGRRSSFSPAT
jgi:outer membrane protein assembly factor BamB